jgi:RNAse (barnase) inhibitor barstar
VTGPLDGLTGGELPPGRYRLSEPLTVRAVRDELAAAGWVIRVVDGASMPDRAALFDEFARACEFPDWFGGNWDAFADCLRDLSWMPPSPLAVLWLRSGAVAEQLAYDAGRVVDAAIEARVAAGLSPLCLIYPASGPSGAAGPRLRPER